MKSKSTYRKKLQFSLRTCLIVLTGCAILFAITGPYIRELKPQQQWQLVGLLGVFVLGMATLIGIRVLMRYQTEEERGKITLAIQTWNRRVYGSLLNKATYGISMLFATFALTNLWQITPSSSNAFFFASSLVIIYCAGNLAGFAIIRHRWRIPTSFEFYRHGLVDEMQQFTRWQYVQLRHWTPETGRLSLSIRGSSATFTFSIDQSEEITAALVEHGLLDSAAAMSEPK